MSDDRDAISRRAYQLWQQSGEEHGRHEEHWRQASREIAGDAPAPDGTTMPAATADEVVAADQAPADPDQGNAATETAATSDEVVGADQVLANQAPVEADGENAATETAATANEAATATKAASKTPTKPRKKAK